MLLYNQKPARLVWDEVRPPLVWDPYGSCEVPEHIVPFLKAQRFPVDITPVSSESKAQLIVEEQVAAARNDETKRLNGEIAAAKADAATAKEALEREQAAHLTTKDKLRQALADVKTLEERVRVAESDRKAAEELAAEVGRKAAHLTDASIRSAAEAAAAAKVIPQPSQNNPKK